MQLTDRRYVNRGKAASIVQFKKKTHQVSPQAALRLIPRVHLFYVRLLMPLHVVDSQPQHVYITWQQAARRRNANIDFPSNGIRTADVLLRLAVVGLIREREFC
jgi:hypothetical protein